jgi:site-specific recombinase XerD
MEARTEEVEQLLEIVTDIRDRSMLLLMLYGGLRVEEVVNLKVAGLSGEPKEGETTFKLKVRGKGRKERVVYLPVEVAQTVKRYVVSEPNRTGEQPLFHSRRGQKMSIAGVQWVLRQYAQQSSIPLTCHRLRHTCARWLAEGEMPLLSLSRFLGHNQLATTQRYIDGAAPQLRRHYSEAMAATAITKKDIDTPASPPSVTPNLGQATVIRAYPDSFQQPVWWNQMPLWWQKDVGSWIKHYWPQWKPSRRQKNAYTKVSHAKRFWLWQMERRAFSGWADLTTTDVQQYVDAQLARNLACTTVSTVLDNVYAILRWLLDNAQLTTLPKRPLIALPDSLPKHLSPHQLITIETYAQEQQQVDAVNDN